MALRIFVVSVSSSLLHKLRLENYYRKMFKLSVGICTGNFYGTSPDGDIRGIKLDNKFHSPPASIVNEIHLFPSIILSSSELVFFK